MSQAECDLVLIMKWLPTLLHYTRYIMWNIFIQRHTKITNNEHVPKYEKCSQTVLKQNLFNLERNKNLLEISFLVTCGHFRVTWTTLRIHENHKRGLTNENQGMTAINPWETRSISIIQLSSPLWWILDGHPNPDFLDWEHEWLTDEYETKRFQYEMK